MKRAHILLATLAIVMLFASGALQAQTSSIDSITYKFELGSDKVSGKFQIPNNVEVLGVYSGASPEEWAGFGAKASKALDGGLILKRALNFSKAAGLKKVSVGLLPEQVRETRIYFRYTGTPTNLIDPLNSRIDLLQKRLLSLEQKKTGGKSNLVPALLVSGSVLTVTAAILLTRGEDRYLPGGKQYKP